VADLLVSVASSFHSAVSMLCCWWIPLLFCAAVVFYHSCVLFLQCRYCYSCGTEWHVLTRDHTDLPATHTFIHNNANEMRLSDPAFTP